MTTLYHVSARSSHDPRDVNPEGQAKLQEIIQRRVAQVVPANPDLLSAEAERLLIEASAGVVRDLVRLLQLAARRAYADKAEQIGHRHAEWAVVVLRQDYEHSLTAASLSCLKETAHTRTLPGTDLSFELFSENFIVYYRNGRIWYYPHSILRDYLNAEYDRG